MNNRQIAKHRVIRVALATLLENKSLWEGLPRFTKEVGALAAVKEALETGARNQAVPSQGATAAHRALRSELRRQLRCASRLLVHHADQLGAVELARDARVNDRVLRRGTFAEALAEARRMETLAAAHPEAFAGSFKDTDFVTSLSETIAAFDSATGKPRLVIVARAAATEQLAKAFQQGQKLLLTLDALVTQFESEDPRFVVAWKHALKGRAPQSQVETETPTETIAPAPEAKAA